MSFAVVWSGSGHCFMQLCLLHAGWLIYSADDWPPFGLQLNVISSLGLWFALNSRRRSPSHCSGRHTSAFWYVYASLHYLYSNLLMWEWFLIGNFDVLLCSAGTFGLAALSWVAFHGLQSCLFMFMFFLWGVRTPRTVWSGMSEIHVIRCHSSLIINAKWPRTVRGKHLSGSKISNYLKLVWFKSVLNS